MRVATKFVNIAKRYYAEQGVQADIIKLYGAMELAPILNLCDQIVDIVDTGNTLRANGLEPYEMIADVSSRFGGQQSLIKNEASRYSKDCGRYCCGFRRVRYCDDSKYCLFACL